MWGDARLNVASSFAHCLTEASLADRYSSLRQRQKVITKTTCIISILNVITVMCQGIFSSKSK
jgi:hypothetical protein